MTDFNAMVTGLPATEAAAEAQLRADLAAQGSKIGNTSAFSVFFRLLSVIFTAPLLYLRDLITGTYLPGIFIGTATGAALEALADGMDEVRRPAAKTRGNLTFTRVGTVGALTIPAGTVVASPPIEGVTYRMVTDADTDILDGNTSALVPATAEAVGAAYNLGDGYFNVLETPVGGITQVSNAAGWTTTAGEDTETDAALRARLKLKWRKQGGVGTEAYYRSVVTDILVCNLEDIFFDLADPRGAGTADIYIVMPSGIPSVAEINAVNAHIGEGNHGLGDDVLAKAIPALNVTLDLTLTALATATPAEKAQLDLDAETLLRAVFRESAAYPELTRVAPFARVSRSALGMMLHEKFPLIAAVDWTSPAADPIPGMQLPVITALTITVV